MTKQELESLNQWQYKSEIPNVSNQGVVYASVEKPEVLIHFPHDQNEFPRMYRVTNRSQVKFLNTARYEWESEDDEIVWMDYFTHDLWILVNPTHLELADQLFVNQKLLTYKIEVVSELDELEECILWSAEYEGQTKMAALLLALQEHYDTTYSEVQDVIVVEFWTRKCARYSVVIRDVEFQVYVMLVE